MGGLVTDCVVGASHDPMTAWDLRVGLCAIPCFLLFTQVSPCKTEPLLTSKTQSLNVFRVFIRL